MVQTVKMSTFTMAAPTDAAAKAAGSSTVAGGSNVSIPEFYTWTTVGRPVSPYEGLNGYNTTLHQYEYWNGTTWIQY